MNQSPNYKKIYLMVLNIVQGSFFFGYSLCVFNPCQQVIAHFNEWIDPNEKSSKIGILTSIMPLGALIGCYYSKLLNNYFDNIKQTLIFSDYLQIISTLIMISNYSFENFFIGRLLGGLMIGINSSIVPTYIRQFSPIEISGKLGSFHQLFVIGGAFTAFLVGMTLPNQIAQDYDDQLTWRIVIGLMPILTSINRVFLLKRVFILDAPQDIFRQNSQNQLIYFYQEIYNDELKTQQQISQLTNQYSNLNEDKEENDNLQTKINFQNDLAFQVCLVFALASQFTGINAVMFYSTQIFKMAGFSEQSQLFTLILGFIQIPATFYAGKLLDQYGRKQLTVIGQIFISISLINLGLFTSNIIGILSIFGLAIAFSFSMGPIPWIYFAEVLDQNKIRLACAALWTGTFITGLIFPSLVISLGLSNTFFVFASFSILNLIYLNKYMIETKNQDINQIQKMYLQKSNNDNQMIEMKEKQVLLLNKEYKIRLHGKQ